MAFQAVLAGLTGLQAISGAYAKKEESRARKATAEANRFIADLQAKRVKGIGREAEAQSRQKLKKLLGKQRAAMAAQGISLAGGSAQDIQQETQDISELDAMTIRINALREAYGVESQARGFGFEAKQAKRTGRMEVMQTLLTGGMRAASFYQPQTSQIGRPTRTTYTPTQTGYLSGVKRR